MSGWWKRGVLYEIYVPSFADSNGDGIGDLLGITGRLDYLQRLGVDGIWLSPVTVSPNDDWGYDVADYKAVQPEYGTLDDLDELVSAAGRRGIRVLLDLVPNHTSDRHPWFVDARTSRESRYRNFYVWADPATDGSPPNNWVSAFMGPSWTLDEATGQYYLHSFLASQPDLNWWNDEVRIAFDDILTFWFDRGVAGFRIDVCHAIVKDAELRDNPPTTERDHWMDQLHGQRPVYNTNRPEVHDVLRRWRHIAHRYQPAKVLLGETHIFDISALASFYGDRDAEELDLAFNFPFVHSPFDLTSLHNIVEDTEAALPDNAWPTWTASNHDVSRFPSRWAAGDDAKTRLILMMLLCLRGTPVLYQGDELGLADTVLNADDLRDPVGRRFWPVYPGRDPARTPMPWHDGDGAGFTRPGIKPWLPFGDTASCNVADQNDNPASLLNFTRDLLALRRSSNDLHSGSYASIDVSPAIWAFRRGRATFVLLNFSDNEVEVVGTGQGHVALGTADDRDNTTAIKAILLRPWEGVVLEGPFFGQP